MCVAANLPSARSTDSEKEMGLEGESSVIYFLQQLLYEKLGNLAFIMNDLAKNLRIIRKMQMELEILRAAALEKMLDVDDDDDFDEDELNCSIQYENVDDEENRSIQHENVDDDNRSIQQENVDELNRSIQHENVNDEVNRSIQHENVYANK